MPTTLRAPTSASAEHQQALAAHLAEAFCAMRLTPEEAEAFQGFGSAEMLDTLLALLRAKVAQPNNESVTQWSYGKNFKIRPIEEQIRVLATHFALDPTPALEFAKSRPPLTPGAEDWFAVITDEAYQKSRRVDVEKLRGMDLHALVTRHAVAQLKSVPHFALRVWNQSQLPAPMVVNQTDRTTTALNILRAKQPADILIFPAQLGKRFFTQATASVDDRMSESEFGLTLLMLMCIKWTHPKWHIGQPTIRPIASGDVERSTKGSPSLYSTTPRGWLSLLVRPHHVGHHAFGAATGFLLFE